MGDFFLGLLNNVKMFLKLQRLRHAVLDESTDYNIQTKLITYLKMWSATLAMITFFLIVFFILYYFLLISP